MTRLVGTIAPITGGACGTSRAFAQAHLQNGARVAMADIDHGQAYSVDSGTWVS